MKRRTVTAFLLLAASFLTLITVVPATAGSVPTVVPDALRDRVQRHGLARVIVKLHLPGGPHRAEGEMPSGVAITTQRRDIAAVQLQVLAKIAQRAHRVNHRFRTIPYLALEVGPAALAELEASSLQVHEVIEDTLSAPMLAQSAPLVQAGQVWARGVDGSGTVIAIVDTGVDGSHPFLSGKVVAEACFSSTVSTLSVTICANGAEQQIGAGAGVPCALPACYHGTHVAGIAAGNGLGAAQPFSGVARGARLMSLQVYSRFDDAATCAPAAAPCVLSWTSDQIAALEHEYSLRGGHTVAAVNLSLGGGLSSSYCDAEPLKPIIDNLRAAGIATVIASGNDGVPNGVSFPSCISSAVSVASTAKNDTVSPFANVGPTLSLFAPGEVILSSIPEGGYGIASGTSMATPHVAGAFALLRQAAPAATVDALLAALQSRGLPITDGRPGGGLTRSRIRIDDALLAVGPPSTPVASLSAAPANVSAGDAVSATWTDIPGPTGTDWIGLYVPGLADQAYVDWLYAGSCSKAPGVVRAAGTCAFVVPSTVSGPHELRLFANNGYTRLATSNTFTVTVPAAPTLSATPTSVSAGSAVTATWNGIAAPTARDWIGLYLPGGGEQAYADWMYASSCSKAPGAARAEGTCSFAVPSTAAGTHELRLYANDGYTRLATSNAFSVAVAPTVLVSPQSGVAGSPITVTWGGIATPTPHDWIGLYVPGAGATAPIDWIYVSCSRTPGAAHPEGTCASVLPSTTPGTYEVRLFANNQYAPLLAVSPTFTVTPSGQSIAFPTGTK